MTRTRARLHQDSTTCPHCEANLQGAEIPEKDRYAFGGKTHYSRLIAVEILGYDRVTHWRCPDCGAEDEREWPE